MPIAPITLVTTAASHCVKAIYRWHVGRHAIRCTFCTAHSTLRDHLWVFHEIGALLGHPDMHAKAQQVKSGQYVKEACHSCVCSAPVVFCRGCWSHSGWNWLA